jgi:hypothetical protein
MRLFFAEILLGKRRQKVIVREAGCQNGEMPIA